MRKIKKFISNFLLGLALLFGVLGVYNFFYRREDSDLGITLIGLALIMVAFFEGAKIFDPDKKKNDEIVKESKKQEIKMTLGYFVTRASVVTFILTVVIFFYMPERNWENLLVSIFASALIGSFFTVPLLAAECHIKDFLKRRK